MLIVPNSTCENEDEITEKNVDEQNIPISCRLMDTNRNNLSIYEKFLASRHSFSCFKKQLQLKAVKLPDSDKIAALSVDK